jgi:hypothetical protein
MGGFLMREHSLNCEKCCWSRGASLHVAMKDVALRCRSSAEANNCSESRPSRHSSNNNLHTSHRMACSGTRQAREAPFKSRYKNHP